MAPIPSTHNISIGHPVQKHLYTLFCVSILNSRQCQCDAFPCLEILHPLYLVTSGWSNTIMCPVRSFQALCWDSCLFKVISPASLNKGKRYRNSWVIIHSCISRPLEEFGVFSVPCLSDGRGTPSSTYFKLRRLWSAGKAFKAWMTVVEKWAAWQSELSAVRGSSLPITGQRFSSVWNSSSCCDDKEFRVFSISKIPHTSSCIIQRLLLMQKKTLEIV